ncbi:MAG: hypothetical protein U0269_24835 [Polyangiales bacterium]
MKQLPALPRREGHAASELQLCVQNAPELPLTLTEIQLAPVLHTSPASDRSYTVRVTPERGTQRLIVPEPCGTTLQVMPEPQSDGSEHFWKHVPMKQLPALLRREGHIASELQLCVQNEAAEPLTLTDVQFDAPLQTSPVPQDSYVLRVCETLMIQPLPKTPTAATNAALFHQRKVMFSTPSTRFVLIGIGSRHRRAPRVRSSSNRAVPVRTRDR